MSSRLVSRLTRRVVLAGLLIAAGGAVATAESDPATALNTTAGLSQLITAIVLENVPHEFEERDNWGHTIEVWDGLRVTRDGLRIKTKQRKKPANHGTWKLYRMRLVDPEQSFKIRVENLHVLPNGRVEFDTEVDARLDAFARLAQWERGVQLLSLSANAQTQVRLRVRCDLAVELEATSFPPAVVLDPVVSDADLQFVDFRLERISQAHGPVVQELGTALREVLEDELAKRRRSVVAKINRQIAKKRDDLRLSLQDLLSSPWGDFAQDHLGLARPAPAGP